MDGTPRTTGLAVSRRDVPTIGPAAVNRGVSVRRSDPTADLLLATARH
jgi:hypothetical protein